MSTAELPGLGLEDRRKLLLTLADEPDHFAVLADEWDEVRADRPTFAAYLAQAQAAELVKTSIDVYELAEKVAVLEDITKFFAALAFGLLGTEELPSSTGDEDLDGLRTAALETAHVIRRGVGLETNPLEDHLDALEARAERLETALAEIRALLEPEGPVES